jgi:predicted O-methyltransferase YrrM
MHLKDFLFSYKTIISYFLEQKQYFKAFKKLAGYPYKFCLEKFRIYYQLDKVNLDNQKQFENNKNLSLDELFIFFNSDKGSKVEWGGKIIKGHNYSNLYEKYLTKFKEKKDLKILEIGALKGASAASFSNYFKQAEIYCLDVNPFQIKYFSTKIKKLYINTRSQQVLKNVSNYFDYEFDIIIDDASHNKRDQIITLDKFLPRLKKDGFYVIEDTCEYLKHPFLNDDKLDYGVNEFVQSIYETGNHHTTYLDEKEKKMIQSQIKNVIFEKANFIYNGISLPEIIFLEKN